MYASHLIRSSSAPVFDSGSSLGYDKLSNQIRLGRGITCKPFKKQQEEQLKLVSSFEWIDFDAFDGIEDEICEILSADGAGEYIEDARKNAVIGAARHRIENLRKLASSHVRTFEDTIAGDVEEDIAAEYGSN